MLDELYFALRDEVIRFVDLYTMRLSTVDAVIGRVLDVLGKANRRWLSLRSLPWENESSNREAIEASRAFRRLAMRRAHGEITALSADPDLAHFLRIGSSREDATNVRDLCHQLMQLLAFEGIREPDPELLLALLSHWQG